MSDALYLIVGAVLGGVVSAVTAVWTSRSHYVHATRIEIFRELLPTVEGQEPDEPKDPGDPEAKWEEVFRAAETLGGPDWRYGTRLRYLVSEWSDRLAAVEQEQEAQGVVSPEARLVAGRLERQVRRALAPYIEWLRRRLGGWRRGPHPILR